MQDTDIRNERAKQVVRGLEDLTLPETPKEYRGESLAHVLLQPEEKLPTKPRTRGDRVALRARAQAGRMTVKQLKLDGLSTLDEPIRATSPFTTRRSIANVRSLVKRGKHKDLYVNLRNLWVTQHMVKKPEGYLLHKLKRRDGYVYLALARCVGKRGNICITLDKLAKQYRLACHKPITQRGLKDSIAKLKKLSLITTFQTSHGNAYVLQATGVEALDRLDDDAPYRWAIENGHAKGTLSKSGEILEWRGPSLRFKNMWREHISEWIATPMLAYCRKYAAYGSTCTVKQPLPAGWQAYQKRLYATTVTVDPKDLPHSPSNQLRMLAAEDRGFTKEVLAACVIADRANEGEAEADPVFNLPVGLQRNTSWYERILSILRVPRDLPDKVPKAVGGWYRWMKCSLGMFFGAANKDAKTHDDFLEYWKEALVDPERCQELVEAYA